MTEEAITVSSSREREVLIVTGEIDRALERLGADGGLVHLLVPHTSAALTVNENADPTVPADLLRALEAMIPAVRFDHAEGNSDSHLLSSLIGCSLLLPVRRGRLALGRWQGVWFVELDGPRRRTLEVRYLPL